MLTAKADRLDASHVGITDTLAGEDVDDPDVSRAPARRRLVVERADFRAALACQIAWVDLARRALEPNVFLDPAFALPLAQHGAERRPIFLLVWEEGDDTSFERLVGLLPVRFRHPLDRVVRGYAHEQVCLGVPLLDRERAAEAWTALLSWLGADARKVALSLTSVPQDGAFFELLLAMGMSPRIHVLEARWRAVLRPQDQPVMSFRSAKRRKELRRKQRRLADLGRRTYVSARSAAEVRSATERFLALEHGGWKGDRGALLGDASLATFTRTMTRLLAHEGRCRIDSLEVDGRAVAMGILIATGSRAYFWKTAFDESYAHLSPGVQLALEITHAQLADPAVSLTDSCAVPNHPMIDRIWPERMRLVDLLLDLQPAEPGRLARILAKERLSRAIRRTAKTCFSRARRLIRGADRSRRPVSEGCA